MGRHPPNDLAGEASAYLRQHAGNPVRWKAWGPAAFEEARRREVPIFLSIGYSTCHWCHVMERESFEDEAIAGELDRGFVAVKVDREERPDVDELYMAATQVMTGHGGWPMSVFIEPERLRPFWCGTYFPPEPRGGMPGFGQVLAAISHAWTAKRGEVLEQAEALARAVEEHVGGAPQARAVGTEEVSRAASDLLRLFDRVHGGFGSGAKFPQPSYAEYLLEVRGGASEATTRDAIDECVKRTLDAMSLGGLRDHLAGGFHRYCVDPAWRVPHFEKMLYDNAALASLYARAAAEYGSDRYAGVARETVVWLLREMRTPEGLFAGAIDADTEGREGATYIWREEQVVEAVGEGDGPFARRVFGLDGGPNFRDPHHPQDPPANVLVLSGVPADLARGMGLDEAAWERAYERVRRALLAARNRRPQPFRDDKAVLSWNAMAVVSLARVGALLGMPEATAESRRTLDLMLVAFRDDAGMLCRVRERGRAHTPAMLEDYAWLIEALATARGAPGVEVARALVDECDRLFGLGGGYYDVRAESDDLFVRARTTYDGATACGNSVLANALLDVAGASGDGAFLARAEGLLRGLSAEIARSPTGSINSTRALFRLLRIDRAAGERLATGERSSEGSASGGDFTPVEVYANTDRVTLSEGEAAEVRLVVSIAPGYHLAGATEGGPGLTPLRVFIVGGGGVEVFADYPEGTADSSGRRVLSGTFEMRVALERVGEWRGRPLLAMAFQACTTTECLPPGLVELSVAIDPG